MVQQADLLPKSDEADVDGLRWMPHTQWMALHNVILPPQDWIQRQDTKERALAEAKLEYV